jgi:iron(III) transport system permease protein
VCGVVGLLFAAPLLYLVRYTVTGDNDLAWLWDVYSSERTLTPLWQTLRLAAFTAVSAAAVGTALAWLTTRTDLPLRRLWAALAPLPLVFPSFVGALALMAAIGPGGLLASPLGEIGIEAVRPEGFWGAWAVLTLFTTPYVYLPAAARMVALPPSLEESGRLLGKRPLTVFRTVVVPQVSGAVQAGALLVFLYSVSDFGVVVMLRYETLTRSIYSNRLLAQDRSVALALLLGLLALTVVVLERMVARRQPGTLEGVRTGRPLQYSLGRWRWPAFGAVVAWLTLSLGLPLAALAMWARRGLTGDGSALADQGDRGLGDLVEPAANTVGISLVTAVVAVAVVLPIAYLSARHRGRVSDWAHGLVSSGFALPGLVVGLAVITWALELPRSVGFYQTLPLLVFAYVLHQGALSLRPAQVAVSAVPQRLDEAARMLGAGRLRRFLTLDLPLMLPGLAAAGGLVLLTTMKELPITLLVQPTGFDTLATHIWHDAESAFLAEAGLTSLVLVALSGVLTWLLVIRRQTSRE